MNTERYMLYPEKTRGCGLAYPYDWRGFVGAKKKTSMGLLVFNPLCCTLNKQVGQGKGMQKRFAKRTTQMADKILPNSCASILKKY